MALLLEFLAQQHTDGHRCGEVRLRRSNSSFLVLPEFFLVTQGAKGNDGDIHVTFRKCRINHSRVGGGVKCVEVD